MRKVTAKHFKAQRGAVLIVALVLLLVLTVLGTASMRDTTMEERMAGNFRDYSTALEAAETALRTGEEGIRVATTFNAMAFDGSDGTYAVEPTSNSVDPRTTSNYSLSVDPNVLTYNSKLLVNAAPEYYIEQLPELSDLGGDLTVGFQDQALRYRLYRVTAKASGVSPTTEVILQSTYKR